MTPQEKDIILLKHYNKQLQEEHDMLVDAVHKMMIAQADYIKYNRGEIFKRKMQERKKAVRKIILQELDRRKRQQNSLFNQM